MDLAGAHTREWAISIYVLDAWVLAGATTHEGIVSMVSIYLMSYPFSIHPLP